MIGGGETVTLLTADTSTDRYGSATHDWSDPTESPLHGCLFAPQSSSEDNDGRTAGVMRGTLYTPPGSSIARGQRVVIRSDTWEIDGDPMEWSAPFARGVGGLEVPVRKVEG